MSERSLYIFVEGKTEERLLKILGCMVSPINCKSKNNIRDRMKEVLEPVLGTQNTGILILRDRDEGETHENIIRNFENIINKLLIESEIPHQSFQPHEEFKNLSMMDIPAVNSRFTLHIAAPPSIGDLKFASDTIDGYILYLALDEAVLERFAKNAGIAPEALRVKVMEKVPKLAEDNGIKFKQAKDFLGVYLAMSKFLTIKRSEKDDVFSGVVTNRAKKRASDKFQETFRSVSTALEFLEIGPKMEDQGESTEKRLESRLHMSDRP